MMSTQPLQNTLDHWSRFTLRQRLMRYGGLALTLLVVSWALSSIDVIWAWVWDAPSQMGDLFGRMMPPDPSNLPSILEAIWQTVNIATLATPTATTAIRHLIPCEPNFSNDTLARLTNGPTSVLLLI
mgnify:CR=1 FL=1